MTAPRDATPAPESTFNVTRLRLGVDTGGTFTDLVAVDADNRPIATHKRLSTPDDPARAVLEGIDVLLQQLHAPPRPDARAAVVHGSTVATNALLEHKHDATCFLTTAGFEDTLTIARQDRPELYALVPRRPDPPVPRDRCLGVHERIAHDGRVITPLDAAHADELARRVRELGVQSVAISLLHSYANPDHERRLADALRRALGDEVHLTVSHELLPEYREYERAATCVVNAVVAPRMRRYLGRLSRELGEDRLRIMGSHGGTLPVEAVRAAPVRTILSGPAGGVIGAAAVARAGGFERVITLDMGGTSTDVALIDAGPAYTTEAEAGGLPVRLPTIDMHTVGAGGGSIAWLDPGGALRVGPASAGADPGPACYGRQTGEPVATVTDTHVVLGHIPADLPLGENLAIDRDAAIAAVQRIADRAGLSLHAAAVGILRVAEATMARAVHRISLQRGHDPREFALLPFGGAGGLHACRLAEALGMTRVLVPSHPGLLSAVGMLSAAPRHTFSQAVLVSLTPRDGTYPDPQRAPAVVEAFDQLARRADAAMSHEPVTERIEHRAIDLRYAGQSYELTVPLDDGDPLARFAEMHQRLYGYIAPDRPIEVVAVRLDVGGPERPVHLPDLPRRDERPLPRREVRVHDGDRETTWQQVTRDALCAGDVLDTPTIITEYSATTVLAPGWRLTVNRIGQLVMERLTDD